jgi:hypothetical protein
MRIEKNIVVAAGTAGIGWAQPPPYLTTQTLIVDDGRVSAIERNDRI